MVISYSPLCFVEDLKFLFSSSLLLKFPAQCSVNESQVSRPKFFSSSSRRPDGVTVFRGAHCSRPPAPPRLQLSIRCATPVPASVMSAARFEFTLDTHRRLRNVPLLNRMTREVEELWNTWSEFVHSNNLQMEDFIVLEWYDMGELSYRVRIWRNDIDITGDEAHALRQYIIEPMLSFRFQLIPSYIFKPTINIPLAFAREHFKDIGESAEVTLCGSKTYQATMNIKYNPKKKIVSCSIKKGVQKFIDGENVEENEKAIIELIYMEPPFFSLIFT